MDHDTLDPKRIGDEARMLPCRAAESGKRVARHVVAALDRDLLDGFGHVRDRDLDEALRDVARAHPLPGRRDLMAERSELLVDGHAVERLIAIRPEDLRKEFRLELAQH